MDAIVTEDLHKRYKTVQALDGVSFSVREGEVFGLLGPNGAGKSTSVRVLTTLTKPDSGRALVAGEDVVRHPNRVRRMIGYVAQDSGVDWEATGRENLLLQGRIHAMAGAALHRRVDELLGLLGLVDAADRVARGYSGGMKRRLDIALGLVHKPRVLFLDEPTTGLDPEARAAMWVEVERLAVQENLTILLTTHYLEEADRLAERVAIVSRGKIVVEGTPEELKAGLHGESVTVELDDTDTRAHEAARRRTCCGRRERGHRRGPPPSRARPERRRRRSPGSSRRSRATASRSPRSRPPGRRSTTSTSTTPAASSEPRTRRGSGDADDPPDRLDGRAPGAEPDARADLDRDDDHPAAAVAAPLRAALLEGDAAPRAAPPATSSS